MPVTRIRPNGIDTQFYPNSVAATGGTADAVTADQSDATYIRKLALAVTGPMIVLSLNDYALAAGSDLIAIAPGLRCKRPGTAALQVAQAYAYSRLVKYASVDGGTRTRREVSIREGTYTAVPASTVATDVLAARQTPLVDPSSLMLCIKDGSAITDANRATVYEAFMDVYALARPTVTLTVNGGTTPVTTTSLPVVAVTVSALIEAWQGTAYANGDVEVRIYTQAQYGAAGFDPTTTAPYWSGVKGFSALPYGNGSTPSTQTVSVTPTYPLTPTGSFRAYARARRAGCSYGAQTYAALTMNLTPISTSITAVSVTDKYHGTGRNVHAATVQLSSIPAGHTAITAEVERTEFDGGTWGDWIPVGSLSIAAAGVDYTYEDGFAPRVEVPPPLASEPQILKYRARVVSTYSGLRLAGDWQEVLAASDYAVGWNFKTISDGAASNVATVFYDAAVLKDPDYQQTEDIGVFRPKGRRYPVVVSNALGGVDGSLSIDAISPIELSNLTSLRELQVPVFVESADGDSRWIRIIRRSWREMGIPRCQASFDFVEVEAP